MQYHVLQMEGSPMKSVTTSVRLTADLVERLEREANRLARATRCGKSVWP